MENQVILEKLESLKSELDHNALLRDYIDGGCAAQVVGELEEIKDKIGTIPTAPLAASKRVSMPLSKSHYQAAQDEKNKRRILLFLVGGLTALLLMIYFSSNNQSLNTLSVIGIFATIGVGWFYKISAEMFNKKMKEYQAAEKQYQDSRAQFSKALKSYEAEVAQAMNEYVQYELRYYENYPKYTDTVFGFEGKMESASAALEESNQEIANNGVISEEYYHLVPAIIAMLKSGRADDYKEALNMAIEEERQEKIERRRREEEARKLEILEQQAEEARIQGIMMARQQEEHNRAMEKAAQAQVEAQRKRDMQEKREQARAAREASSAAASARQQALHRCSKCSKRFACSVKGNPNCGAFDPDAIFKH